jgi:hypothetical protein
MLLTPEKFDWAKKSELFFLGNFDGRRKKL